MTLDQNSLKLLQDALDTLNTAFADMPAYQPDVDLDALRPILLQAAEKMQDNYPYPHPLYAGQMLKPPALQPLPVPAPLPLPAPAPPPLHPWQHPEQPWLIEAIQKRRGPNHTSPEGDMSCQ